MLINNARSKELGLSRARTMVMYQRDHNMQTDLRQQLESYLMASKEHVVRVQKITTVKPTKCASFTSHFLSNLDLLNNNTNLYFECLFFFKTSIPRGADEYMKELEASLAKALDEFQVLAGRVKDDSGRPEIEVNGAGVPFYQAVTNARFDDWADLRNCGIDLELNPPNLFINKNREEYPLLRVQATVFECGGLVVGISNLHLTVDGASTMQFVMAWSEIHKGLEVTMAPSFETRILEARDPAVVNIPIPKSLSCLLLEDNGKTSKVILQEEEMAVKQIIFEVRKEGLEKVMEGIEAGQFGYGRVTRYEATTAVIWKCITKARWNGQDDCQTGLTIPVSVRGRNRLHPPLPPGYCGNAALVFLASTPVSAIANLHISYTAKLIHDTIHLSLSNPELARSFIDWLEIRGKPFGTVVGTLNPTMNLCTTDMSSFPVYDIDFGWGSKLHLFKYPFPFRQFTDGMSAIIPCAKGGRSREVVINLKENHMDRLLADPLFSSCFLPVS